MHSLQSFGKEYSTFENVYYLLLLLHIHVCITYACACMHVVVHLWGGQGKTFRSGASPAVGSETQTPVLGHARQGLLETFCRLKGWSFNIFISAPESCAEVFWSIKSQVWKTKLTSQGASERGCYLWAPGQSELHCEFWASEGNANKHTKVFHKCPLGTSFSLFSFQFLFGINEQRQVSTIQS